MGFGMHILESDIKDEGCQKTHYHEPWHTVQAELADDRYNDQWPVLKTGKTLLKTGRNLLIFPEGRRTRNGAMNPFLNGAAYLSVKTAAPIIPAFIKGTGSILPPESSRLRFFGSGSQRKKLQIVFGHPIQEETGN